MIEKLKENWRFLLDAAPGDRFLGYYQRRQQSRASGMLRIGLLCGGILLSLIGIVMLVAPGPGLLAVAAGMALVAGESRAFARGLDSVECALRKLLRKSRRPR